MPDQLYRRIPDRSGNTQFFTGGTKSGFRLDCGTASESIDRLLEEKMYPIVKVRRKSGAVHWIMLTGTEKDTHDITAMDPIDGFVHMSDYDNRIYGVRVVTGSVETLETNGACL